MNFPILPSSTDHQNVNKGFLPTVPRLKSTLGPPSLCHAAYIIFFFFKQHREPRYQPALRSFYWSNPGLHTLQKAAAHRPKYRKLLPSLCPRIFIKR